VGLVAKLQSRTAQGESGHSRIRQHAFTRGAERVKALSRKLLEISGCQASSFIGGLPSGTRLRMEQHLGDVLTRAGAMLTVEKLDESDSARSTRNRANVVLGSRGGRPPLQRSLSPATRCILQQVTRSLSVRRGARQRSPPDHVAEVASGSAAESEQAGPPHSLGSATLRQLSKGWTCRRNEAPATGQPDPLAVMLAFRVDVALRFKYLRGTANDLSVAPS
jgi:hypothetical protein